jgi:parallel beta-helix repeat protein
VKEKGQEIDVIKFSAVAHGGVSGLYINCANGDATSGYGAIAVRGASSFIGIENVVVNGHNSGLILEDPCTDCWIDKCIIDGQLRHNIRQVGAARCRITNNTLIGASREPVLFNAPNSGTVKDLIFNNNYIEAPNTFDFIQIATSTTPTYTRLKFTENTFIDNGTAKDGINTGGLSITDCDISHNDFVGGRLGFELYLAEDCTIDNNRVSGCEESGIVLLGSINNLISNNIVKNCDQISASGNKGGITLRASGGTGASNNTIIGNRCYDDQGSKTQTYGIKIVDATCIDNEISGNNLDGNLTGKISDAGVANRIDTPLSEYVKTLDNTGTPSVEGGHYFLTSGTTGITDFDDGVAYQVIVVIFGHSTSVADTPNIFLNGSSAQLFADGDSLTLIQKADGLWYELARSVG